MQNPVGVENAGNPMKEEEKIGGNEKKEDSAKEEKKEEYVSHTSIKQEIPNTFQNPLNFKRGELIAAGAYGKVYKCLDLNTGRLLAVKNVKVPKFLLFL
jgi:hypothetical protein